MVTWREELAAQRPPWRTDAPDRLVLLGTAGGSNPKANRGGFSNAVVVGDAVYVVDCGEGVHRQLWRAGLTVNSRHGSDRPVVRAVFLTHLHADHMMDLPNLFQGSWLSTPVDLYGPGPAGPPFTTHDDPVHPVRFPDDPAPGIVTVMDHFHRAFATNINSRIVGEGRRDYLDLLTVHEIELGEAGGFDRSSADFVVPPVEPFVVRPEDEHGVTVTATLAQHAPVFPAFAFRFDTPAGSVVFSGDTGRCENVVRLAQGADVLVHEVIDLDALLDRYGHLPNAERIRHQLSRSHTSVHDVGAIAARAGVGTLVLSHIVPADDPRTTDEWETLARGEFTGRVVCAVDLDEIPIG